MIALLARRLVVGVSRRLLATPTTVNLFVELEEGRVDPAMFPGWSSLGSSVSCLVRASERRAHSPRWAATGHVGRRAFRS